MSKRQTSLAAEADGHGGSNPSSYRGGDDPEPEPSRPGDEPLGLGDARPAVELILQTQDADPPAAGWLEAMLLRVMAEAQCGGAVTLVLVDDDEMAAMHERYTGVSGTTDVLTFDHRDQPGDPEQPLEGDIILCVDEASRQAARRGHEVRIELLLYAVHGLLHLLGEDDHEEAAYQRMHAREDELLRAVGVGEVFAKPQAAEDEAAEEQGGAR